MTTMLVHKLKADDPRTYKFDDEDISASMWPRLVLQNQLAIMRMLTNRVWHDEDLKTQIAKTERFFTGEKS